MPEVPLISNRDRICLSCRDKGCCSYYQVTVTARDLMRISRAMQLAPADFLTYVPLDDAAKGSFLLHPDGPRHILTLARRASVDQSAGPCIFLLRLNDGHALCGLGSLQPGTCRTFPLYLDNGFVALSNAPSGCARTWSYGDIDLKAERDKLIRFKKEEAEYHHLVEEWNERVREGRQERSCDEFCTFLVNHSSRQEEVV